MPIAETIRGFDELIEGKHDELPERAFFLKGTIEQVLEAATRADGAHPLHRRGPDPGGRVFNEEVEMVSTRTTTGSIGLLAGHEPLLARLEPTELRLYRSETDIVRYAQAEGYVQMSENRALLLVEEAIDPAAPERRRAARARRGRARARSRPAPPEHRGAARARARPAPRRGLPRDRRRRGTVAPAGAAPSPLALLSMASTTPDDRAPPPAPSRRTLALARSRDARRRRRGRRLGAARCRHQASSNWAGWVRDRGPRSQRARPPLHDRHGVVGAAGGDLHARRRRRFAAFWVGLGGYALQLQGARADRHRRPTAARSGQLFYYAWYEFVPRPPVTIHAAQDHARATRSARASTSAPTT